MKKLLSILTLILTLSSNHLLAKQPSPAKNDEYVVILHGIARSKDHMADLAEFLQQNGYHTVNINYPSTKYPLKKLSQIIQKEITSQVPPKSTVNFVGYSMGGLLIRIILQDAQYENLGKAVQLAPPNNGSEVADFIKNNWLYQKIYGPAGQQLTTDQKRINHLLNGKITYPLGVIAGNFSIDPISSAIIPGDDDGKVSIASTKIDGMQDHIIIKSSHTFFPSNKNVQKQVLHFLKFGKFKKPL
jgi:triacylglycerol lipase